MSAVTTRHPRWLTRTMLIAIYGRAIAPRHEAIVQAALAGPPKRFDGDPASDLAGLAAMYAAELAKTHGFIDGSKRAAFLAAYVFLGLNGYDVDVPEPEVVAVLESAASRKMSEAELAGWFRSVVTRTE